VKAVQNRDETAVLFVELGHADTHLRFPRDEGHGLGPKVLDGITGGLALSHPLKPAARPAEGGLSPGTG
jgi:hypothetical protein